MIIGLLYLLFWQVAPRIHSVALGTVLLSTLISLALVILVAAETGRICVTTRTAVISLMISGGLILPLRFLVAANSKFTPLPWSLLLHVPGLPDLLFIWFAGSLGALLSRMLRSTNLIPPVAAVLALVDIWTVLLGGPVQKIMQSQNPAAQAVTRAMTVKLPAPSPPAGAEPMSTQVGFADFLFVAFFSAAITRFVGSRRVYLRMCWVMVVVLGLYMIVVFVFGWNLPALVPMSVVMLALHWRYFHYDRSEAFAMLYAGLFIAAIACGFWYFSRHSEDAKNKELDSGPHARVRIQQQNLS
ncbi:MAG: hypothetical protein ABJA67_11940 [Chthonomonadales bacterium]